jgi:O-antigen/teichoic acid export membrane protein
MKTNNINKHEEVYIHLPKRAFKFSFLTILLVLLTIGSFLVTIEGWKFLELDKIECSVESCNYNLHQLLILPILFLDYILIALFLLSFVSMFKKLKRFKEDELINGLIGGLILGLIFGLVGGLVVGSIGGLVVGLIGGLILGLIIGLIFGLITGLNMEF